MLIATPICSRDFRGKSAVLCSAKLHFALKAMLSVQEKHQGHVISPETLPVSGCLAYKALHTECLACYKKSLCGLLK